MAKFGLKKLENTFIVWCEVYFGILKGGAENAEVENAEAIKCGKPLKLTV